MTPSRGRSLLFSAVVFVLFFGALEGLLRVVGVGRPPRPRLILRSIDTDIDLPFMRADPDLFWSPRPGFRGEFQARPVTINGLGLRGPEPAATRPARRVLCLGDSITFGYGVGDDETYPSALGRLLGPGAEVINGGVTGYTSHQVLALLRRVGPVLRPDVVTVLIGWNDRTRRAATDREYAERLRWAARAEGLADRLHLYRALSNVYAASRHGGGSTTRDRPRVPAAEYRENLAAIASEVRALGARVVLIDLPHRSRFEGPALDPAYPATLREAASALGVALADVGPLGDAAPPGGNEPLFIDSLHLSRAGAEEMARRLAVVLKDASAVAASPATPASRPVSPLPADCVPITGPDWTGRYRAEEAVSAGDSFPEFKGHAQVMVYVADVFRDAEGRWRAFVNVSGQTTYRAVAACGVPREGALELRVVRARSDDHTGVEANAPVFTLERAPGGKLRMRFPDGSYLEEKPVLEASREPLPPWAGAYTFDGCPGADAAKACWRYRLDVALTDEGWKATVAVDGPETTERHLARGEDYESTKDGDVLALTFLEYAPGDAHRGPALKPEENLARLFRRRRAGATRLDLGRLPSAGEKEIAVTVGR